MRRGPVHVGLRARVGEVLPGRASLYPLRSGDGVLYPWAVLFRDLGLFGFIEMAIFVGILLVGLVYAWKKGALDWQ